MLQLVILFPNNCIEMLGYVRSLLEDLVKQSKRLYGDHWVTHYVYGLLHIPEECNTFRGLNSRSTFQFKNMMQIKK